MPTGQGDSEICADEDDSNPFFSEGDQDLVGLWESLSSEQVRRQKLVCRDWGIPTFQDQMDKGMTTFILAPCEDSPANYPRVRIHLEHRRHSTGSDLWDSALVLAHCLGRPGVVWSNDASSSISTKTVLELGSGTGAVGLFCAKCLAAKEVVLTDLKDNLELLRKNTAENNLDEIVKICPLNWTQDVLPTEVYLEERTGPDVIVGSDLFLPFASELLLPLAKTLVSLLRIRRSKPLPPSVAILVYEERFDCSDFFRHAASLKLDVTRINSQLLHPLYQDPGRIHALRITLG